LSAWFRHNHQDEHELNLLRARLEAKLFREMNPEEHAQKLLARNEEYLLFKVQQPKEYNKFLEAVRYIL
jgi:hypothetical protein